MKPPMVSSDPQLPVSNPFGLGFAIVFPTKKKVGSCKFSRHPILRLQDQGISVFSLVRDAFVYGCAELPVQSSHQWATSLYRNPGQKVRCKYNVPRAINHPYFVVYTTHKNGKFGDSRGWFILLLYPAITCGSLGFKGATTLPWSFSEPGLWDHAVHTCHRREGYHRWAETKSWIPEDFPTNSRIPQISGSTHPA